MRDLIVPKFDTEAEEAEWWDRHMDVIEENLVEAMETGKSRRLSDTERGQRIIAAAKRALAAREAARVLLGSLSEADRNQLHHQAANAGLDVETYVQQLLLKIMGAELAA